MEQLTTNHLFINLILSSFAYAYILHQLKIFVLKTGEPFDNFSSSKPLSRDQRELTNLIISLVCLCSFTVVFWGEIDGDFDKFFESTKSIIGNAFLFVFILISLYFTFINAYERYRWRKEKLIIDLPYFLVFEAISFAHYCAVSNEDGFMLFLGWAQFCAALSYMGGMALLLMASFVAYPVRILIIFICLTLCMSGYFSILNWKF
jgi:hypothetical protein